MLLPQSRIFNISRSEIEVLNLIMANGYPIRNKSLHQNNYSEHIISLTRKKNVAEVGYTVLQIRTHSKYNELAATLGVNTFYLIFLTGWFMLTGWGAFRAILSGSYDVLLFFIFGCLVSAIHAFIIRTKFIKLTELLDTLK